MQLTIPRIIHVKFHYEETCVLLTNQSTANYIQITCFTIRSIYIPSALYNETSLLKTWASSILNEDVSSEPANHRLEK